MATLVHPDASAQLFATPRTNQRLDSIDYVRGFAMVFMALDHVRYFFTSVPFPPEHGGRTWLTLFLTRWVTHFCAPVFLLLMGMGAYLTLERKGVRAARRFLWTRGVFLIFAELTFIGFAWGFVPGQSFAGVIWTLGWTMVVLAALIRVPPMAIAGSGAAFILLHNLLDRIPHNTFGAWQGVWAVLYSPGPARFGELRWFSLFPILPWAAVAFVGFGLGKLYARDAEYRHRWLMRIGTAMVLAFVLLRLTNAYGNPHTLWSGRTSGDFVVGADASHTIISLLNTEKYPPSLQYLLMTLGPSLLALAWLERIRTRALRPVLVFGRVPMFYYILHLYFIHLLAIGVAMVSGQPYAWLGFNGSGERPEGYGYGLPVIYLYWLVTLVALYPLCSWYMRRKQIAPAAWMSYI